MQQTSYFLGHKDAITGLTFRERSHELLSCSMDRTVKLWSVDDRMYIDTFYGHQAEILCVDCYHAERPLTGGLDRSCRLWRVTEESQLVYMSQSIANESCRLITKSHWVTGNQEGCLSLWSSSKKKTYIQYAVNNNMYTKIWCRIYQRNLYGMGIQSSCV